MCAGVSLINYVVYAGFTHSCDVRRFSQKGHTELTLLILSRFSEIVQSHQPILHMFLGDVLPDTDHLYITV